MTKVYLSYQDGTPSFFFLLPEAIKNKKIHMSGIHMDLLREVHIFE